MEIELLAPFMKENRHEAEYQELTLGAAPQNHSGPGGFRSLVWANFTTYNIPSLYDLLWKLIHATPLLIN
jgi:hypothetical protein